MLGEGLAAVDGQRSWWVGCIFEELANAGRVVISTGGMVEGLGM